MFNAIKVKAQYFLQHISFASASTTAVQPHLASTTLNQCQYRMQFIQSSQHSSNLFTSACCIRFKIQTQNRVSQNHKMVQSVAL